MAYPKGLSESEVQKVNKNAIRDWIEKNKARIKTKPNKTILYAGHAYDLDMTAALRPEEKQAWMGTPMFVRIKQMQQRLRDRHLPSDFKTLEDVLKSIPDYPVFVARDGHPIRFSNAFAFFMEFKGYPKLLLDANKTNLESWGRLSELFAGNAEGYIHIFDGVSEDYKRLSEDRLLLDKELVALMKNDKLSPAAKEKVRLKVLKYGKQLATHHKDINQHARDWTARLKKSR